MAYGEQYISHSDPFWDGALNERCPSCDCILPEHWDGCTTEPMQAPTLTGDALTRAEARLSAIADLLAAISGPFGPVNVPHCNACTRRSAASTLRDSHDNR